MAIINLYSIPEMDMTYQHVPDFANKNLQNDWFAAKRKTRIDDAKIHITPNRTSITVPISYAKIESMGIDYCSLYPQGDEEILGNKIKFYFVADYEYVTSSATTLVLKLDVMQTYMFDYVLMDSFIERCHVDRYAQVSGQDVPSNALGVENLAIGDYVYTTPRTWNYRPRYIISSTTPLGMNDWKRPSGTGGKECGDWEEGILSPEGFRFIKGFEAFAPIHYLDTVANPPVNTIAYGVTEHGEPEIYKKLVAKEPVKEEEGAMISYDLKNNNYGKRIVNVCKAIGVTKQHQFDALVSLAYNAGVGAVTESGSLMQLIKKDPTDCAAIKAKWETYYNASQVEGVRLRRIQEAKMFCGEKYEIRPINIVDNKGRPTGKYVTENGGNGWLPDCAGTDETKPVNGKFRAHGFDWVVPVDTGKYKITAAFPTYPKGGWHGGTDIGTPTGANVYATRDGEVIHVEKKTSSYGYHIIIQHTGNLRSWYAHNSELLVSVGDKVKQGQLIAKSGATGNVTGPHLHYELRKAPYRYGDGHGKGTDCITPIPLVEVGDTI